MVQSVGKAMSWLPLLFPPAIWLYQTPRSISFTPGGRLSPVISWAPPHHGYIVHTAKLNPPLDPFKAELIYAILGALQNDLLVISATLPGLFRHLVLMVRDNALSFLLFKGICQVCVPIKKTLSPQTSICASYCTPLWC